MFEGQCCSSEGDFANTNFSSNIADLVAAADYMREHYAAPKILIGHSLGGAAVIAAAASVPEASAVATIGAPYEPDHVRHLLAPAMPELEARGESEVVLGGRKFRIQQQFLDDLAIHNTRDAIAKLRKALLILHSPLDTTVDIENAAQIIRVGRHTLRADEPEASGGNDSGPSPYDLLLAGLGACTSMTLRMYAALKEIPLEHVIVRLRHGKIHATDCAECETNEGKIDKIDREIELTGPLDEAQRKRLLEIADRCPVHRPLQSEIVVSTHAGGSQGVPVRGKPAH